MGREFLTGLGQFDIDNVAKLLLCVIRDADNGRISFDADSFMIFAVAKIVRNVCH